MTTTYANLVDEITLNLSGYTLRQDRTTHLTADVTSTGLSLSLGSVTNIGKGVVEIDDELIWLDTYDRISSVGNIAPYVKNASTPADFSAWANASIDPSISWADLAWIRSQWDGPLVIKGILSPEDAVEAVKSGADGIIVSNHGGRQLDGVASSISMLPRIADKVSGQTKLLVDGGVRSGQVEKLRRRAYWDPSARRPPAHRHRGAGSSHCDANT
jgi:hypothetical protein